MQLINENIKCDKVRIVGGEGFENIGVVTLQEALKMSEEAELDLVQMSEKENLAICKILNYSKFLYEQKKAKKNQQKGQKKSVMKEIKFGCNIAEHDLQICAKKANNILDEGDKVRACVVFKGRQIVFAKDQGPEVMERFLTYFENISIVKAPKLEGTLYTVSFERKNK